MPVLRDRSLRPIVGARSRYPKLMTRGAHLKPDKQLGRLSAELVDRRKR